MTTRTSFLAATTLAAALLGSSSVASAQFGNFVIPPANAGVEGSTGASRVLQGAEQTIQMLWGASNLVGVGPGSVTGIWFRLDAGNAGNPSYPVGPYSWASYTMRMSTSSGPLTSNLTANEAGSVLVRSGPLSLSSGDFTGGSSPNPFSFFIPFSTPFFYGGGDLFLSIRHGDGAIAFQDADVDATASVTDLMSAIVIASGEAATSGFVIGGPNNQAGGVFGLPVIAQIQVVPEPSSVALMTVGLLVLAAAARRRKAA